MATNNFKVFNESMSNIESDAQYAADAQRIGGVVPGVASSVLHNKLYRQVSIMVAALGQLAANRGYNASDADLSALVQSLNGALGPPQSVADTTYYVSPTGSDSNTGTSAVTPFKTIAKAVSLIPQVCNHNYTINVAAGTYNEDVLIVGILGSGVVTLTGDTVNPANVNVKSFKVLQCTPIIMLNGFNATSTTAAGFAGVRASHIMINQCSVTANANVVGITFDGASGRILSCNVSNRSNAIEAAYAANVYCSNNTGSGNTGFSMLATQGGTIHYTGSYPGGNAGPNTSLSGSIFNQSVNATEGNLTLFVSTTGNDTNDGMTAGTALRNIQTAINRIPQIVNHTVTINVAAGTYSESINFVGFMGSGIIQINPSVNTVSTSYSVNQILVVACKAYIKINGLNITTTGNDAVYIDQACSLVFVGYCNITGATGTYAGIVTMAGSISYLYSNTISNKAIAINTANQSTTSSDNNTGTGNSVGLKAGWTGTIGKIGGSQPSGTTAETTVFAGVIR